MRTKPRFTYNGLTVVLSNPSRNDKTALLTGWAGQFFNNECLRPECNVNQIDVRTSDTLSEGLLENTQGVLLLGERAMKEWSSGYDNYSLNEQRGCPLRNKWKLPMIASFNPQDAVDFKNHESNLNPLAQEYENEKEEDDNTGKRKGNTAWSNYRFWLIQDSKKILRGSPILSERVRKIYIYPTAKDVIEVFKETQNQTIILDIETDALYQITCLGIGIGETVYVIPFLRYNYHLAYENLHQILKALAILLCSNTVVCHNSVFDLFILAWKYRLPFTSSLYDTMLAFHRCFPEAEKSLGHVMSWATWEEYHKDEGIFMPRNEEQEYKLWNYNAKDVWGTKLCMEYIDNYALTQPGLRESIQQSNESIRPFIINTLQGIRYDEAARIKMVTENDALCMQYVRMAKLILGNNYDKIQGKSKSSLLASPPQAVKYFHDMMGYKPQGRTPTGDPSLKADYMYKLKLKYPENILIDLVLAYRERAKESGSLGFIPWKV